DTGRLAHRIVEIEHDLRMPAAEREADDIVDLLLAAGAHAARALDAGVEIDGHRRVRDISGGLRARGEARRDDAEKALPLCELRVELVDALGDVGHEHLDHDLLRVHGTLRYARHLHPRGGCAAAGRGEYALALDLDHAGAAVAFGSDVRHVTQVRNVDAMALRRFDYSLARNGGDIKAIIMDQYSVALYIV